MSNQTASEKAREAAEAARVKQAQEAADRTAKAAEDSQKAAQRATDNTAETQAKIAADSEKAADVAKQELADGETSGEAALKSRELALEEREARMDRLMAMLEAQGGSFLGGGTPADQPKSAIVSSPGAQNNPLGVQTVDGRTTGPLNQPHPALDTFRGVGGMPAFDYEDDAPTVYGRDPITGRSIKPREYPQLVEQDVRVVKAFYFADSVRNAGEILRGYTGPLGSAIRPIDDNGQDIPLEKFHGRRKAA